MELEVYRCKINFSSAVKVSRESYDSVESILVKLTDKGNFGLGEACEFPVYQADIDSLLQQYLQVQKVLAVHDFVHPSGLWRELRPYFDGCYFALSSIDIAAYDLWAKAQGLPLRQALGIPNGLATITSRSIPIVPLDHLAKTLYHYKEWPKLKIKVNSDQPIEYLQEVRRHYQKDLMIDVNCGWSLADAMKYFPAMKQIGVKFIEEPLQAKNWSELAQLSSKHRDFILADESFVEMDDLHILSNIVSGINIKTMKVGGITPALRIATKARELGINLGIGCMPESSIGLGSSYHIAPLFDYVDLDSITFFSNDPAQGLEIDRGVMKVSNQPGTGISIKDISRLDRVL